MKNIFKIYKRAHVLYNGFSDMGIEFENYAIIVQEIAEFILESYGISPDNDYFYERVHDFGEGLVTQKELKKELEEFKK